MKKISITLFLLFAIAISLISCKNEENPDSVTLELEKSEVTVNAETTEYSVNFQTNSKVPPSIKVVSGNSWCSAGVSGKQISIIIHQNETTADRTATINVSVEQNRKSITLIQKGKGSTTGLKDDVKISVQSGTASSTLTGNQTEGPIEFSFDDNPYTIYHSQLASQNPNIFPATLNYNFGSPTHIDYIIYTPRVGASYGNFQEFDLYYRTNTGYTLYGTFNFNGSNNVSRINLGTNGLDGIIGFQFVVKSANSGVVSCAEMGFYQRSTDNFNYLSIFTDDACWKIKSGITITEIDKIDNPFFKNLAKSIFDNTYDSEFRVQDYKAWQRPSIMANINKTSLYSLRDNPTGMFVEKAGDELVVLANDLKGSSVTLCIQDLELGFNNASTYPLNKGINLVKAKNPGLMYILYHTDLGTESAIKINITGGKVNGYFDSQKQTKADWSRILNNATYREFDVLGKYSHLTYPTSKFKEYTPDGAELISKYDSLVYWEQDFLGLVKYNKMFKNRMYFCSDYSPGAYMSASTHFTAYSVSVMSTMCSVYGVTMGDPWGPAHEVGHVNQTRPMFSWKGLAEVSNNITSNYVQTKFGKKSGLILGNYYTKAINEIITPQRPFNFKNTLYLEKLVPFWQLKLYIQDVLGRTEPAKKDFYKDLYEYFRNNTTPIINTGNETGSWQLNFTYAVCLKSNLDLTEFFETWGFFRPINSEVDDYGKVQFIITEEQANQLKKKISDLGLPKPKHTNIHQITDENLSNYY